MPAAHADIRRKLTEQLSRYGGGEWRAPVFRDMVLDDVGRFAPHAVVLDIGCGKGFDGDVALQRSISEACERFVGIEPDTSIDVPPHFDKVHACGYEDAPLKADSIGVAYCVFVLEHVADPGRFWRKTYDVLVPGGVFWGFTVDARHYFAALSNLMKRVRIKEWYLQRLRGERGAQRYEDYPTYYRANAPGQIAAFTGAFARTDCLSVHRVGQLDFYLPRMLRPIAHLMDRLTMAAGFPGSVLVVRLEK